MSDTVSDSPRTDAVVKPRLDFTNDESVYDAYHALAEHSRQLERALADRQWIPVGERLPDEWVRVLGRDQYGNVRDVCRASGWYGGFTTAERPTVGGDSFCAIHWMPLPK